jgi:hypothetical protein
MVGLGFQYCNGENLECRPLAYFSGMLFFLADRKVDRILADDRPVITLIERVFDCVRSPLK